MRRGTLVLLAAALGAIPLGWGSAAAAVDCDATVSICQDLNDAKASQHDTQRRLADIQTKLKDTQSQVAALVAEVARLNARVEAQKAAIAETQVEIDETDREIRFTQADIARREAHLRVREQLLDQRVRAMDKHGAVNYLELVVTSRDFNQLIDRIVIMQDIIRSDRRLLDQLRQERDQIRRLQEELRLKRAQQAELLQKQQQQRAEMESTVRARQKVLDYYRVLESQYDEQRKAMEAEKARIDALVLVLQQQYEEAARRIGGGTGQFVWPESSRLVTQGFGCSSLLGEPFDPHCPSRHTHYGIDIGGPPGAPIYAADAGIVSLTMPAPGGGYGNYVVVTHGGGYSTLYAHMTNYIVRQGQPVTRGQTIGYEGSTGYSTGPHLHFEIRYGSNPVNPCAYLGC